MTRKAELIQLYSSHRQRLGMLAYRMLRNWDDADDAVQCAFTDGFVKLKTFQSNAKLSTWLTKILINECLERLRAGRSMSRKGTIELTDAIAALCGKDNTIESDIQAVAEAAAVKQALSQLPEIYQPVLKAFYYDGKTAKQIARDMTLGTGAVKSRLHRGIIMMRSMKPIQRIAR